MFPDTPGVAGCPEWTWYVMAGLTLLLQVLGQRYFLAIRCPALRGPVPRFYRTSHDSTGRTYLSCGDALDASEASVVRLGSDSWGLEEFGGGGADAGRGESPGWSDEGAVLYDARSRGLDEAEDGRKVESMGDAR
ncbi:MAG: hypothetical protein Q9211_004004 [Gyalolechia sp. 1 TL-2023]